MKLPRVKEYSKYTKEICYDMTRFLKTELKIKVKRPEICINDGNRAYGGVHTYGDGKIYPGIVIGTEYIDSVVEGGIFPEYKFIAKDPEIGQATVKDWMEALQYVCAHEMAHVAEIYPLALKRGFAEAYAYTSQGSNSTKLHNEEWKEIYRQIRRHYGLTRPIS